MKNVTENLDKFELGLAAQKVQDFIWDVYCDWYIEIAKLRLNSEDAAAAAAPAILILDFSAVTFMDSSGIGLILGRHKLVSAMGGVVVVQKAPKDIKRMLSIAGIESKD